MGILFRSLFSFHVSTGLSNRMCLSMVSHEWYLHMDKIWIRCSQVWLDQYEWLPRLPIDWKVGLSTVDPRVGDGVGNFICLGLGQAPHLICRAGELVQYVLE